MVDGLDKQKVLIVDDAPENIQILMETLKEDYAITAATNGEKALKLAEGDNPPDLILLDIIMPGMDGYEVCRRLKDNDATRKIPVIFVTAKSDVGDETLGFKLGAADYIIKPISPPITRERVRTHLALYDQNRVLEEKVKEQTLKLVDAHERLRVLDKIKDDFLQLISHELRTPLHGMLGVTELLIEECPSTPVIEELAELFNLSRDRMIELIDDALLLTQIGMSEDRTTLAPTPLRPLLTRVVEEAVKSAQDANVSIGAVPDCDPKIVGEEELLEKAMAYMVTTAVKCTESGGTVDFDCTVETDTVRIDILATGYQLPDEKIDSFFDMFSMPQPLKPDGDLGLAPTVAQKIISLFDGKVSVRNLEPPGIAFETNLKLE